MNGMQLHSYGVPAGPAQKRIGFFLPHTFAIMPFIAALEPLRAANRYSGENLYSWHIYGETDAPALCNNGIEIQVEGGLETASDLARILVAGPHDPHRILLKETIPYLKKLAQHGTYMGAFDTGCFLLARANLIKNKCTLHWENIPGFREEFPNVEVSTELFEIDGNLFTCAGGAASMDMMLNIIQDDHGNELARRVAELFVNTSIRTGNEPQRMNVQHRHGIYHKGMVDTIELMETNIEQPLTTQELAECVGISKRQLERLFRAHLQSTPTHYYQTLRLKESKRLLEQTTLSIVEVAVACGFLSAGHFTKRFRLQYGRLRAKHAKSTRKRVLANHLFSAPRAGNG